eukprot:5276702-Amphidinium_carterae.2
MASSTWNTLCFPTLEEKRLLAETLSIALPESNLQAAVDVAARDRLKVMKWDHEQHQQDPNNTETTTVTKPH